jgi:hypothetical protein
MVAGASIGGIISAKSASETRSVDLSSATGYLPEGPEFEGEIEGEGEF